MRCFRGRDVCIEGRCLRLSREPPGAETNLFKILLLLTSVSLEQLNIETKNVKLYIQTNTHLQNRREQKRAYTLPGMHTFYDFWFRSTASSVDHAIEDSWPVFLQQSG